MIVKTRDTTPVTNKFEQAGAAAEEQMAFYLRRAFADAEDIFVFNDLRLVDGEEPAQIDHLVLHPFGVCIIESKSICGEVEVNEHDEWIRKWGRQRSGMPSPIQQAKRQGELLQKILNDNREALRDKRLLGMVQAGFAHCPVKHIVAISDRGIIARKRTDPEELKKADQVCDCIKEEIARHCNGASLFKPMDGDYGLWKLNADELARARDFLLARHTPCSKSRPAEPASPAPVPAVARPTAVSDGPACKHCGRRQLHATHGRYGYYFKCHACEKNTPMDFTCSGCGKKGRIRKQALQFFRTCKACGHEELVWENKSVV